MRTQSERSQEFNSDPGRDCQEATVLGVGALVALGEEPALYKLISADNLMFAGIGVWRLTFKLKELIPETADSEIGAGGELFVEADLSTQKAELVGRGE